MDITRHTPATHSLEAALDGAYAGPESPALGLAGAPAFGGVDGAVTLADGGDDQSLFRAQFSEKAADPEAFHALLGQVFGPDYDVARAERLRQRALTGDFGWLPEVHYVDAATLGGAHGAYDAGAGVVYLDRALQGTSLAARTFVEEAGHHLDATLNTADAAGDEGELFRRVLGGETLSRAELAAVRAEDDRGTIVIDGRAVEVEFWNPFKAIGKAIGAVGKAIGGAVKAVGKAIDSAVGWVGARLKDAIGGVLGGLFERTFGFVKNLWEAGVQFVGGLGKMFRGDFLGGLLHMAKGALKLAQNVDPILHLAVHAASAIQTRLGLEPQGRPLTDREVRTQRDVYGDSIAYSRIRIKVGFAGLFSLFGRALAPRNTIVLAKRDLPITDELLTREMARVWQHQNGGPGAWTKSVCTAWFGSR